MTGDVDDSGDGAPPAPRGRRRLVVAAVLLGALLALSGCNTVLGPGPVQEGELAADPGTPYDWDTGVDGYLEVNKNNYTAVYEVANRTTGSTEAGEDFTMELYTRDALGTDQPLDPSSLQFRYENGTVLRYQGTDDGATLVMVKNGETTDVPDEKLAVSKSRRRTTVQLPTNRSGQLAFTAPKNGKQVATPTFIEGSYEMALPEGARVGLPVLAQVQPSRSGTELADNRVHVKWDSVTRASSVIVRYYLVRDLYLFGGLVALMLLVGIAGAGYYYLQIRETVQRREEVGIDIDIDDDDDRDPPPGMG
ncbi:hypothetical protein DP107_00830 [Haloglomus irregulare]|jgi:hypothetical protein|uniref:Uncharacterized protein n=1 Tax=Haloglomus irregulare TaxID=2234134 RepID=A0A554NEH6_9EURY|nr:DUF5803 family protein [Haloglomus irregulare]TSD15758.1 hypothetical protein DP107_00830 [Haloglomus irregulare]